MASIFHGRHKSNTWASQWENLNQDSSYSLTDISSSCKNKPWISRKNDKVVKIMIKRILWKTIEGNTRLKARVRLIWFYSKLAATNAWWKMLQTLLGRKNMRRKCQMNNLLHFTRLKNEYFKKIEKLQGKAIRIINFRHLNAPVDKQKYELNILKLKDFIMLRNILFVKGCLNGNAPGSFNDKFHSSKLPLNHTTRSSSTYQLKVINFK